MTPRIFRYPERKYDLWASFDFFLHYRRNRRIFQEPKAFIAKSFAVAVDDVCDYLRITTREFFEMADLWSKKEQTLFANTGDPQSFYRQWKGEYAGFNICANVLNQHLDSPSFAATYNLFSRLSLQRAVVADFGCGTAALTTALVMEGVIQGPVHLFDVPNQVNEFVRHRIEKHNLGGSVLLHDVEEADSYRDQCDVLFCVDVLEHLENSSRTFIERVDPMIRRGGYLYLKAPWRGQITHLDAAASDFYGNGGRSWLRTRYRMRYRVGRCDIAAVYQKR